MKLNVLVFIFFFIQITFSQNNKFKEDKVEKFKKNILCKFKKENKKYKKEDLSIYLIYWVSIKKDSFDCDYDIFLSRLNFNAPSLKKILINDINKEKEFVLSSIIAKDDKIISEYNEGKYFCAPSIFGQNLLNAILKYNAKNIYYLVNFESESYPYVIVKQNNKMYIYYDVYGKVNSDYKVIPCVEALSWKE